MKFSEDLVSLSSFIQRFPDQLDGLLKLTQTDTSSGDTVGKPVANDRSQTLHYHHHHPFHRSPCATDVFTAVLFDIATSRPALPTRPENGMCSFCGVIHQAGEQFNFRLRVAFSFNIQLNVTWMTFDPVLL